MRSFLLSKVAIPLHLAFVACYLVCVQFGYDSLAAYLPLAWFSAGLLEIALLFPTARKGEEARDARRRVLNSILKDPILLLGVVGFLFILLQTLNGPRAIAFNAASGTWDFTVARIRDFPACISRAGSVQGLFWNMLVIPTMLVIGHGMGRKGRTLLLKFLVSISALLALFGLLTYDSGAKMAGARHFFAFPDAVSAGIYFFMNFCVACALYATEVGAEIRDRVQRNVMFVASAMNLAGALYSLSCLCIALSAGALVILVVYCAVSLSTCLSAGEKMRMTAVGAILIGLVAFLHFVAYPKNRIHDCTAKILSREWTTEQEQADRAVRTAVAWRIFKANPIHGVGTWGYADAACFGKYMGDDEWDSLANPDATPENCGNDMLQYLVEYGIVGFLLAAAPYLVLLLSSLYRIAMEFRPRGKKSEDSDTSSENEARPFTERITPLAFALFLATAVPFAVSFRFSILRLPAILFTWTAFIAVFPTLIRKPDAKGAK